VVMRCDGMACPVMSSCLCAVCEHRSSEQVAAHFRDFIGIHKPFMAEGYIPRREEVCVSADIVPRVASLVAPSTPSLLDAGHAPTHTPTRLLADSWLSARRPSLWLLCPAVRSCG
jgi:hypothetical protein